MNASYSKSAFSLGGDIECWKFKEKLEWLHLGYNVADIQKHCMHFDTGLIDIFTMKHDYVVFIEQSFINVNAISLKLMCHSGTGQHSCLQVGFFVRLFWIAITTRHERSQLNLI